MCLKNIGIRLVITILVLFSFTDIFTRNYGDWFQEPKIFRGTVKALSASQDPLILISQGEETIQVRVDQHTLKYIQKDDEIEVIYLPLKLNVIRCRVLTQQAEKII